MTGRVLQINISFGGIPKRAVPEGTVTPLGIQGDQCAHPAIHGGPDQALLLIASEAIDDLIARGYPLFYGALGENITTRGLDRFQLRVGQTIRLGTALIELTKIRVPCSTLDQYGPAIQQELYDKRVKAGDAASRRWGMSGFYASVLEPGLVRVNDIISIVTTVA